MKTNLIQRRIHQHNWFDWQSTIRAILATRWSCWVHYLGNHHFNCVAESPDLMSFLLLLAYVWLARNGRIWLSFGCPFNCAPRSSENALVRASTLQPALNGASSLDQQRCRQNRWLAWWQSLLRCRFGRPKRCHILTRDHRSTKTRQP